MKFKSIFLTALAAVAVFASCQKPEEDFGKTALNLDRSELTFTQDASTQTINLTSSRPWEVSGKLPDWISIDPMGGSASKSAQALEITVLANEGMERVFEVLFSNGTIKRTLKVTQAGPGGSAADFVLYSNNFDKTKSVKDGDYWPFLDKTDCWKNEQGSGISSIEYVTSGVTPRNSKSGNSDGTYSDYAGSGVNYLWFGTGGKFILKNIALNGNVDLKLSFGAERNEYKGQGVEVDNTFNPEEFVVYVSNDAQKWVAVNYTFAKGVNPVRRWDLATSIFSVPAATENLSIAIFPTVTSAYALDDLKLEVSAEKGTEIDFSKGTDLGEGGGQTPTPQPDGDLTNTKLGAVIAAKDGTKIVSTEEVLVVATHARGYLLFDGIDYVLAYTKEPFTVKAGDRVVVSGEKASHNGWAQIASPVAEVKSSGNPVNHPTPNDITGSLDNFSSQKVEYLKLQGTLEYAEPFFNVNVEGAKNNGSIAYADDELAAELKKVKGSTITLEGYFIGGTAHFQIMVVKYVTSGDYLSPDPMKLEFESAAGEKSFTVYTNQSTFNVESSDPTNFAVTTAGNVVTVKATENLLKEPRTAHITVTSGAMTETVQIIQNLHLDPGEFRAMLDWSEIAKSLGLEDETDVPTSVTAGDFTLLFDANEGTAARTWSGNSEIRLYKKNILTIKGTDSGLKIKSIKFIASTFNAFSANVGTLTGKDWAGDSNEVIFTASDKAKTQKVQKFDIIYTK